MPDSDDQKLSGGAALKGALLSPTRSQIVVGLLLGLLGFGAVTQFRTTEVNDDYAGVREQDLIVVLSGLSGAEQRAQSEIDRLEGGLAELRDATQRQEAAIELAQAELDTYAILAGTVPVTGPGISASITIPDQELIRSETFLDLIQELRTAGAEAIEINEVVRVVAETSISTGRDGLVVGGVPITLPITVKVIGDPDALRGALMFPDGPVSTLAEQSSAQVSIVDSQRLSIIAIRSSN